MFGKLIWRNTKKRPWQSGLTIFILLFCTTALIAGLLLVRSIEKGGESAVDNLGADIMVIPAAASFEPDQVLFTGAPVNIYMNADVLNRVKKISGVEEATAQFFSQTLNQSCCSLPEEYRFVGYDPETDFLVEELLSSSTGRGLYPDEVIVGGMVPAFLGDRVVVLGKPFDVAGYLKPMGGSIDKTIFVPIETARKLAGASPYLQEYWVDKKPDEVISSVLIKISSDVKPEEVINKINKIEGARGVLSGKLLSDLKEELLVMKAVLHLMVLIICCITVASLASRYSSLVLERQEELALLRALGMEKNNIFKLLMLETISFGLAATVIGSMLGYALIFYLEKVIREHSSFPFLLPSGIQLLIVLGGVSIFVLLICSLAAFWPARNSSQMDPMLALTRGEMY